MRARPVAFSEAAGADLLELEIWLESVAGKGPARRYVDRLIEYCLGFDLAAERGSRRDDLLPGLRIVGFKRRLTIAFAVHDDRVEILRLFRAGRDWEAEFGED